MSRRDRRHHGGAVGTAGGGQEIERLLAKGRVKDAFKQAKLAFRQEATPENRRLLERTYLLRVQDLLRGGMPAAAAEVARAFLELGVNEPGALGELAAILPQLGMIEEARRLAPRLESSAAVSILEHSLADQAVLHPERAATPEAKAGAERIRSALAALDAEQEPRAMELLQDIPRSSPWADWRYFVRGLAAYRRGDGTQAGANFDHLDERRAAHRIALRLWAAAAAGNKPGESETADASAMEAAVFGQPVLARLDRVRRLVDRGNPKRDFKQALPLIASLTTTLRRLDPRLAERLTQVLIPPFFDETTEMSEKSASSLLEGFSRAAAPLRLDPHWSRLWALCYEQAAGGGSATDFWKKYSHDLEEVADLRADERRRMQALVWRHIGRLLVDESRSEESPFFEQPASDSSELRDEAVRALEESLRFDPSQRETYVMLVSVFEEAELAERAAEVRTRLLAAFPDDVETLKDLFSWHMKKGEAEQSLEYIRRARKLRPLDTSLVVEEHTALISLARQHALARRFDEARVAFARAEALNAVESAKFGVLARQAVCELKAGNPQHAEELIERAKAALPEPAPLWLVLAIEADRYKLAAARRTAFNKELDAALKKRKHGETAGKLADLISAYHAWNVDYRDKARHLAAVTKYVKATSRTPYTLDDLERVCQFLANFHHEDPLLSQLVARGLRKFPRSPVFHIIRAEADLPSMPRHFNFKGISNRLAKALELAQADPARYASLVDPIKRQLAQVERVREMSESMDRAFGASGGFPGGMPAFFRMMETMINEDGELDENEFDDDFFVPPFFFDAPPKRGGRRNS